jgi:hypothetical protein
MTCLFFTPCNSGPFSAQSQLEPVPRSLPARMIAIDDLITDLWTRIAIIRGIDHSNSGAIFEQII